MKKIITLTFDVYNIEHIDKILNFAAQQMENLEDPVDGIEGEWADCDMDNVEQELYPIADKVFSVKSK